MTRSARFVLQEGLPQSVAAATAAAGTATLIAMTAAGRSEFPGRLAGATAVLFVLALTFGSARAIGLTTLPMLGAAIGAVGAASQPMWARSIIIGALWYLASELAWDAVERREGAKRSPALNYRRAFEVSTVITIALTITGLGFIASELAPTRTLLSVGLVVVGLFLGLGLATRHISEAGPDK